MMDYFGKHKEKLMEYAKDLLIWTDSIDDTVSGYIEGGLRKLAQSGDKDAAVLYGVVAAYRPDAESFSDMATLELLLEPAVAEMYEEKVKEEFEDILEDDELIELMAFPVICFFKMIAETDIQKNDTEE